jgi:hypothetical protein
MKAPATGATTLLPYREAFEFAIECGGSHVLTLTVTGGGQIHFTDGAIRQHIRAADLARQIDRIKGVRY